jgi:hypothetical protein
MPPNRYPTPALLQEIARLRYDLTEQACRARAEALYALATPEGLEHAVRRLRERRAASRTT